MKNELPIKYYRELLTSKGRKENSAFIVEGVRQVEQFVKSDKMKILEILSTKPLNFETKIPVTCINNSQLCKITESKTPNGVIAVVGIPKLNEINEKTTKGNILLLEDIQDPGNVGTLIRSAAAFGFSTVILSRGCSDVYSPKVVRSTGGAICNLEIISKKDIFECIEILKKQKYNLIVADLSGNNKIPQNLSKNFIFALGNEGNGVSNKLKTLADFVFTIPINTSAIESLNVSAAGAIGMYILGGN
ncbi:MAG: RNA methyltransferase [Chitinivibrionia bacterium]|nr:RNA methyltransferase [Chitinivibrionia bacterium]